MFKRTNSLKTPEQPLGVIYRLIHIIHSSTLSTEHTLLTGTCVTVLVSIVTSELVIIHMSKFSLSINSKHLTIIENANPQPEGVGDLHFLPVPAAKNTCYLIIAPN